MSGSNYPPGVTGNEPQIAGYDDECAFCGQPWGEDHSHAPKKAKPNKDAQRFAWLTKRGLSLGKEKGYCFVVWMAWDGYRKNITGKSFRDAIDAAMKHDKEKR